MRRAILLVCLVLAWTPVGPGYVLAKTEDLGGWVAAAALTTGRAQHTATLLQNGKVLVAGGVDAQGVATATAELFDPSSSRWTAAAPMQSPRIEHTATLLSDGRVLVAGGRSRRTYGETLDSAEVYDPASGRWNQAPSMRFRRAGHTATLLPNGEVLVVGGRSVTEDFAFTLPDAVELYDPRTNQWSTTAPGSIARQGHTATLLRDGRVLVVGGMAEIGLATSAQIYDPTLDRWSAAWLPATARSGHTATLLPSGIVLVLGGVGTPAAEISQGSAYYSFDALSTGDLYDPTLNLWTRIRAMNATRIEHTATVLKNGAVLVVGGAYANPGHPETYEVAANRWVQGTAVINRHSHTATLLPDGRVLIVGGFGIDAMSTAWTYRPDLGAVQINRWGTVPTALALLGALGVMFALIWGDRLRLFLPRWPRRGDPDQWVAS